MVDLKERLADYGLTLEPDVVICDRRVVDKAVSRIAELEAEVERYKSGLQVLATTFYKADQHQDYAKHVLGTEALSRTGAVKEAGVELAKAVFGVDLVPAAPEGQQEPVAVFGNGEVLVGTGTFRGRPAVLVRPAPVPGPVGQLAPEAICAVGLREILPGEWFITFPTDEQACAVADALVGKFTRSTEQAVTEAMVDQYERAFRKTSNGIAWFQDGTNYREAVKAALKAAMEAGRHD